MEGPLHGTRAPSDNPLLGTSRGVVPEGGTYPGGDGGGSEPDNARCRR